ncbi:hypothetical protein SAMN04488565_0967 [Leucobacter chromiiresistens]|uniref:Uncharacterized protein n=1 Tax=Leucobacter chromiiresistens TaxID=1079994 RepID=A0A1H0YKQ4_9MICO|nr:hypothetical protein SAMN04488565_0967 [Leucobacter chromiiresistens]
MRRYHSPVSRAGNLLSAPGEDRERCRLRVERRPRDISEERWVLEARGLQLACYRVGVRQCVQFQNTLVSIAVVIV